MNKTLSKNDYIKLLSKRIFWDLNIEKLDYKQDCQKIIERIAMHGTEEDERIMNSIYSIKKIKKCLLNSRVLNEKVINYYAFALHEREEKFKCYMRIPVQMNC